MRRPASIWAMALAVVVTVLGCASKGGMREFDAGVTLVLTDPMDAQLLTPIDDLSPGDDGIQYAVVVSVGGLEPGAEVALHVIHLEVGGEWDYTATVGTGDVATFSPVTFWPGTAEEPSEFTLVASALDGQVTSEVVQIEVIDDSLGVTDLTEVPDWEIHCIECDQDAQCDDGLTCPGREECGYSRYAMRKCCYTVPLDCTAPDSCHEGECSEEMGGCVFAPLDFDDDGHTAITAPDGTECGGTDCDDDLYAFHPGAREICDGLDNDCDLSIDEDGWVPAGDPIDLSGAGEEPSSASIAWGDTAWGVAWISDTTAGRQLHAGVIKPGDPTPVATTSVVETGTAVPMDAVIVPAGSGFALLVAVPITDGTVIEGYPVSADGTVGTMAHDMLVFWGAIMDLEAVTSPSTGDIGIFFRANDEGDYQIFSLVTDWPPTTVAHGIDLTWVTRDLGFSGWPSAVATGSGFAVAWEEGRDGNMEIYFALLGPTGEMLSPGRRITSAPGHSQNASLSWSPGTTDSPEGFGLAWMDSRAGAYDLLFTCLDGSGNRTCPEIGIGTGPDIAWYPDLVYQGYPGQFALSYAGRREGLFGVNVSAVPINTDRVPLAIDAGTSLGGGVVSISGTQIENAGSKERGVLWTESVDGGSNTLRFQQLACGS